MADVVQHACAPDAVVHKKAQAIGRAVREAGIKGRNTISSEGYIINTINLGEHSVSRVIDPPAIVLWMNRNNFGLPTWYFGIAANYGMRGAYLPDAVPVADVDFAKTMRLTPAGYQYVAPDYGVLTSGAGRSYAHGLPTQHGDYLYGTPHARVMRSGSAVNDDLVMVLYGARWSTPLPLVSADNALVPEQPSVPALSTKVLAVPAVSLAVAGGKPDVRTRQIPNDVFYFSAALRDSADEVPVTQAFFAVNGRDPSGATRADRAVVIIGRVDQTETTELPIIWGAAPSIGGSYALSSELNVVENVGLHVGTVVTVVATIHNDYGGGGSFYETRMLTLNPDTGAVLSNNAMTTYPALSAPICTAANALWVATATTSAGVVTACGMSRIVDGVVTAASMSGWMPLCTMLVGISRSDALWPIGAMAPAVVELGGGRLGVIACPAGSYNDTTPVPWYLIEIDAATLTFIGARANIGDVSLGSLAFGNPRYIAVTVVTPQVVVDDVVTTPAVLLSCVMSTTKISTDGGYTWTDIANGAYGYPYYFGNKLHPVELGKTL